MKTYKFRYKDADGNFAFKEVALPNDAVLLVGLDTNGKEVYEGDTLRWTNSTIIARLGDHSPYTGWTLENNHADN